MGLTNWLPPIMRSTVQDLRSVRKNYIKNELLKKEHAARLQQKHIDKLEVLLDRKALLSRMPKGVICAEVGVAEGEFSRQILDIMQPEHLHLIDLWHEKSERYADAMGPTIARVDSELKTGIVAIHRGYSWDMISQLPDDSLDWIYIDAAHDYHSVKRDLDATLPKMKVGSWICGHDYTRWAGSGISRWGVREAVNEFCIEHDWRFRYLTFETHGHASFAIQAI